MFNTFFFSELNYRFRQPMIYIFLGIITLLVFGATSSDNVQIGDSVGNVYRNSPHTITSFTTVMTIFGLLIAAAFFNNAALKDYSNGFDEILFSTPLSKPGFYFGRFCGALISATVPLLGVFIGVYLGSILAPAFGWIDADRFGSMSIMSVISNYFLFILPNMFFAGAIIFALAVKWQSAVISFVGAMIIIIGYIVSGSLLSDLDNETLGALLDSFGIRTYDNVSKYYTTLEKNTLTPSFGGLLLLNRMIWIGVGSFILLLSFFNFSFLKKNQKQKKSKLNSKVEKPEQVILLKPITTAYYSTSGIWSQFKSFFSINFLSITKSATFKIFLIFSLLLFITRLFSGFEYMGLKSYPLTYKMIESISAASGLFLIIMLVFFSGELIWRDRESKINEVIDATPHVSFISLFAKAISLISVVTIFYFLFVVLAIIFQVLNGFTGIELDVYILSYLYKLLPTYIVYAGVLILVQVLMKSKYLAYFVSVLIIFVSKIFFSVFDIESNMLFIADRPNLMYSDLNGFGPGLKGALWFNAYWILFALVCLSIAGMLWNRGIVSSLKSRIRKARKEVPKKYLAFMTVSFLLWVAVAGFVFYNTQILNSYKTGDQIELLRANYEKKYKKFEKISLPKITAINYFVAIFPEERGMEVKAIIQLTNESHNVIDSIHFNLDENWETEFNIPNSELVLNDKEFDYMIYKLNKGLQPHETIEIEINNKYVTKGFENTVGNTNIIKNGTFVNHFSILPGIGYQSRNELSDNNTRKKYDLQPKERAPVLEKVCSGACMSNYLSEGLSDYINVETIISTSSDQTAIAPGSLIKEWKKDGRNYYHYKVDHPSQNFYSFISARYEVAKRKWNDVDIEVYYDKKHGVNVEMMLDAVERSLTYFSQNFGPYYHKQCRIIEFPRYSTFAQAFPGTMPYSESFGFVMNLESKKDNNVIDAVISHEMAHQWWAHQVVGASMQGGTLMSESFAEYSSLMTMKSMTNNPMKMRKFLKYDHDRYLRGRSGESEKELPLYKVENQQYIHYGKGSVILYALQDYIGEDKVNLAMRNFLEEFKYKAPPYPTSYDFLKHLEPQVPDSLNYLINDWFKEITLYDNRLKEATYKELANGKFEVEITVESAKIYADSLGTENRVATNDWIDVGVFADSDEDSLVFNKRIKINKPNMAFTFIIDNKPVKAAIDPKMLLIDRVYEDNSKRFDLTK